MSSAKGRAVLEGVPANSDIALSFFRSDLYPGLRMFRTESSDPLEAAYLLPLRSTGEERFEPVVGEPQPSKGALIFDAFQSAVVPGGIAQRANGVAAMMRPESGVEFFLDDDTYPNAELEATSAVGLGGFMNVEPGLVTLSFRADANRRCSLYPGGFAWSGDQAHEARALVVPGFLSFAGGVVCN
jgi:hypothetical protein